VASWAENQKAESAGQPHALLDGAFWQLNFKAVVLAKRPIRRNSRMTVRVVLAPTNAEELWQVRKEAKCQ
jgi:hypothetical protein